jgi:hypothetical protein
MVGRYVRRDEPSTYYELHADGTYTFGWKGHTSHGTYTVQPSLVRLKNSAGIPRLLPIVKGELTDNDGAKLKKVDEPGEAKPGSPAGAGNNPPPASTTLPADGAMITLSMKKTLKRYGAEFPKAQLPANTQNYFWVVDRPDNETKVAALSGNEWHIASLPGLYKIRVEYRSGDVKKVVSNELEVTVPAK